MLQDLRGRTSPVQIERFPVTDPVVRMGGHIWLSCRIVEDYGHPRCRRKCRIHLSEDSILGFKKNLGRFSYVFGPF